MIEPGTIINGRYRVVRHLGSGAMASVHLAEDQVLQRPVAIKAVHTDAGSEHGRRVQREARFGARLGHPHLVSVYDTIVENGALLIVLEYVPGRTLAEEIAEGPLAPDRAIAILRPLAEAIDHVHAGGVVHRDVKPANVLLDERHGVKLADLGVATSDEATQITRTGGLLGTAAHMAPEQFDPGPVTGAADIYALATVAYEMLTGQRPYAGANVLEVMHRVRAGTPPNATDARPAIPAAASEALQRGMALLPEDRPITAGALVDELDAAFRQAARAAAPPPPPPPPPPAPEPTRRQPVTEPSAPVPPQAPQTQSPSSRRGLAAAGVAAVLAAIVLVVLLSSGGDDDPATERAGGASTAERTTTARDTTTTTTPEGETGATPPATPEPDPDADPEPDPAPAPTEAQPTTPDGAVRALYDAAAADDLDDAWALASPNLRAQLGGRATFDGTFRTLRSIRFDRAEVQERSGPTATVAITTVATHTDRVDNCRGTATVVRVAARSWQVDRLDVTCS